MNIQYSGIPRKFENEIPRLSMTKLAIFHGKILAVFHKKFISGQFQKPPYPLLYFESN